MIAWRAALCAGYPSADQYLEAIDSDEWTECLAFYELDPFGEERADIRHALLMHLLAHVNGDKHSKPIHFMPFQIGRVEPDPENLCQELDAVFGLTNGRKRRKT